MDKQTEIIENNISVLKLNHKEIITHELITETTTKVMKDLNEHFNTKAAKVINIKSIPWTVITYSPKDTREPYSANNNRINYNNNYSTPK